MKVRPVAIADENAWQEITANGCGFAEDVADAEFAVGKMRAEGVTLIRADDLASILTRSGSTGRPGRILQLLVKRGLLTLEDYGRSSRKGRHKSLVRLWRIVAPVRTLPEPQIGMTP